MIPLGLLLKTLRLPQTITGETDVCGLAIRWGLSEALAAAIIRWWGILQQRGLGLQVISGARSRRQQSELGVGGRPTAPFHLSTHADEDENGCQRFATGIDARVTAAGAVIMVPDSFTVALWGEAAFEAGLRWGGDSPRDPATGVPSDWHHVDLGPRSQFP